MAHRQRKFVHIHNRPELDLIEGSRSDMSNNTVEGVSKSLSAGVNKVIWNEDSAFHYESNTNISFFVVSTSGNDVSSTGSGARQIRITGLTTSLVGGQQIYSENVEDINLNGTTNVIAPTALYRILKIEVISAGSNKVNEGDIKAVKFGSTEVLGCLEAGTNKSNQLIVSPKTGENALIENLYLNGYCDTESEVHVNKFSETSGVQQTPFIFFIGGHHANFKFPIRMKVAAGETVWVSVKPLAAIVGTHNHICGMLECTNRSVNSVVPSFN